MGVVYQIDGHKPSGTVEKHYQVRPLDMLRKWHTKFEAWFVEEGRVPFEYPKAVARLGVADGDLQSAA
jgi:hypothetical protein